MSHLEISAVNSVAPLNNSDISRTAETSQSPIGPCSFLHTSPNGDNFRHSATAALRAIMSLGANEAVETWIRVYGGACDYGRGLQVRVRKDLHVLTTPGSCRDGDNQYQERPHSIPDLRLSVFIKVRTMHRWYNNKTSGIEIKSTKLLEHNGEKKSRCRHT